MSDKLNFPGPKTLTIGELKQMVSNHKIPDDMEICFMHRESWPDDEGKDHQFLPAWIWGPNSCQDGKQRFFLVGAIEL